MPCDADLIVEETCYELDVGEDSLDWGVNEYVEIHTSEYPKYHGQTEFEPTTSQQLIHVAGMTLLEDLVIDPIPSNYGRITYDGSKLTVS